MKVAVVGTGRTGGALLHLLEEGQVIGPFNSFNPVTAQALAEADVAIAFVPGAAALQVAEQVFAARIPFVCGATGIDWPHEWHERLVSTNQAWVVGSNFSLGMALCHFLVRAIGSAADLFEYADLAIHEVHHQHKLDAPSGSALEWNRALGRDVPITHERIGEVFGVHTLTLSAGDETVELRHTSHDRAIYAKGALWAASQLLSAGLAPGLHQFQNVAAHRLQDKLQDKKGGGQDESKRVGRINHALC